MIFQVKTTRQKSNLIISVYAAWEAWKIYEHQSLREGWEHTEPMQRSCWLATAAPLEAPLTACGISQQMPEEKGP